jgi:hypothetical protein
MEDFDIPPPRLTGHVGGLPVPPQEAWTLTSFIDKMSKAQLNGRDILAPCSARYKVPADHWMLDADWTALFGLPRELEFTAINRITPVRSGHHDSYISISFSTKDWMKTVEELQEVMNFIKGHKPAHW